MKNSKKLMVLALVLVLVISVFMFVACNDNSGTPAVTEAKVVRISSTSSVRDSGLMQYLLPYFTEDTGYTWELAAAATGAAIKAAKFGNADVILVHSKTQENDFINCKTGEVENKFARKVDGYASERITFMYNYFVMVGPNDNAANVQSTDTAAQMMKKIYDNGSAATGATKFVSRGDNSGTRGQEDKLWKLIKDEEGVSIGAESIDGKQYAMPGNGSTAASWFVDNNSAMGATLSMANELKAYCLTDKATFLNYQKNGQVNNLKIVYEESPNMINNYSIIAINKDAEFISSTDESVIVPDGTVSIDETAANIFINWMCSVKARNLIANYGQADFGDSLFSLYQIATSYTETAQA